MVGPPSAKRSCFCPPRKHPIARPCGERLLFSGSFLTLKPAFELPLADQQPDRK